MPLTIAERKHLLPFGAQKEIAEEHGVGKTYVSLVVSGDLHPKGPRARRKLRRVQAAIARRLGRSVDEVFGGAEEPTPGLADSIAIPA